MGLRLTAKEPSPSWLVEFLPQAHRLPSFFTASVNEPKPDPPADTDFTFSMIFTGVSLGKAVPSPTSPYLFEPQPHKLPSEVMKNMLLSPAVIEVIGFIDAGWAQVVIVEGKKDNVITKHVASMINFKSRFVNIAGTVL